MVQIGIPHVEYLAHRLARGLMEWDEPIPPFDTRFPGRLESCLGAPFQTFTGRDLYATLPDKAAILFYLMVKNHPFQNGNKRIAVTTLTTFLFLNGRWLSTSNEELCDIAIRVAESLPVHKEFVLPMVAALIERSLQDIPEQEAAKK